MKNRHCEVRSNPKLYRENCIAALPIGDCFVPRNDAFIIRQLLMTSDLKLKTLSTPHYLSTPRPIAFV